MANRRMFSAEIINSDRFLDLSQRAQLLYFHLGLAGDDEGFCSSTKRIMRTIECTSSDLDELIDAGFIIRFDNSVIVIVDWKRHNFLRNDRFKPTIHQAEKAALTMDSSKRWALKGRYTDGKPMVSERDTQLTNELTSIEEQEKNSIAPSEPVFDETQQTDQENGHYVPKYWELDIPPSYYGKFATEDEYWNYMEKHGGSAN